MIRIKRGLDLPINGAPEQAIHDARPVRTVAVLGHDYVGMKPTMEVKEGDKVKLGQTVFTDKKTPGVVYTAPGSGVVKSINRGERRVFLSLVIELDDNDNEAVSFASYPDADIATLAREKVVENMLQSGLWTALRTRPFSKVPDPESKPSSIFINLMDSNPLALDPEVVAREYSQDFVRGVNVLARLTEGKVFLCRREGSFDGLENEAFADNVVIEAFAGPHPSGLSGTHIHFLDPVSLNKWVWTIGFQDVIATGKLFATGQLWTERLIALAGPQVNQPRLLRTRLGASLSELTDGELNEGENRLVTGSVLSGRKANAPEDFLGRYHQQVTVLREGRERPLFGYLSPGANRHSNLGIYLSSLFKGKKLDMTTTTNGSERAMVPVGTYETVMPLDILPTQLLRSLIVGDIETAMNLGALELDEDDLGLCTYVCPGKYEYGPILRDNLTRIEKET
ncbi:NADH:ubiquinone reductase (Na(+)-transporting) subunit A [Pseudohongiella acticola]|jgi:Na+-transporting NADH:ubiquinone oxidoreductase subunit A|uniref:Na(+)-translocating NADH-quinone reductase subunit A n=1 Tax=Pseudohongiella acticola TaxID=1524254 RepID=A0A1E8CGC0_9GAMM|nr:Na(+)-translocating NADH-quinone reductase subunit A [Pseudohongiella acticola]OFE11483.1 NADH:ubiquinone reductase (Na(+)-transporting) subunit A [Pseudohongiella acticola]